jgi:catechol 2,3-dioxygenase-like lactoylglutathione lyase family enzyme
MDTVRGIHHVTAITADIERNVAFYAGVLGLRVVKRTVNFDDPGSWHLYFGDELGRPGTIMTFFVWPDGHRGRQGTGQVGEVAFAIPSASLGWWIERLMGKGIPFTGPIRRFGEQVLELKDPDGIIVQLVGHEPAGAAAGWAGGPVPAEHAVRAFHSVTIWEDRPAGTAELMKDALGFREMGAEASRLRLVAGGEVGGIVDIRRAPGFWKGADGAGTVHHVAFRAADDEAELRIREQVAARGLRATPQVDRSYFRSVYFREPGGVLFELATEAPGFTTDESAEALGRGLMLPPQFERRRAEIEGRLPPFPDLDAVVSGGIHALRR